MGRITRRRSSPPRLASWKGRRGSGSCRRCLGNLISATARCRSPGSALAIATSVREVDGEKVIVKVTTIPKGTRSQSWMGPTDLHDYTIQADVQGRADE